MLPNRSFCGRARTGYDKNDTLGGNFMERCEIVLAAMTSAGRRARFDPVKIQTVLFLIDREVPDAIGGPLFDFRPHDFGPLDPAVFDALERLAELGNVVIDEAGPYLVYRVSDEGAGVGRAALRRMPKRAARYSSKAARWALAQSFWGLVAAIHRAYPEMALDGPELRAAIPEHTRSQALAAHPFLAGMASVIGVFLERSGRGQGPRDNAAVLESDWWAVGDDIRYALEHANSTGGH